MASNPHEITRRFEAALCEYTGARYAVAVNSCTMAILLAVRHWVWAMNYAGKPALTIPARTYVGVPMSIIHAGAVVEFSQNQWRGRYQIAPTNIYDCARRFTSGMYEEDTVQCVSFHATKILGDTQGGAILHDEPLVDEWYRRARFDGRMEGVPPSQDTFDMLGWHCYISPDVSARLLWKLAALPKHNEDLPHDDYPDLSLHEVFK